MTHRAAPEEPSIPLHHIRARMRAASISLLTAGVLLATKFIAYRLTGSAAILSDALESIVNVAAAAMALFSVWYGAQPADADHPYGHGKVEDFSVGVEGALIVLAALGIFWSAVPRFFEPRPLESLGMGGLLISLATAANLLLGLYLVRVGREHHSKALVADGRHVLTDVISSVGAVGALIAVSINRVVRGVTTPIGDRTKAKFSVVVPPTAFAEGTNQVEVLRVEGRGADARFERIAVFGSQPRDFATGARDAAVSMPLREAATSP